MQRWKAFLAGTFLAAATLGSLGSIIAAPAISALALPLAVTGRIGATIEVGGSLMAGVLAAYLAQRGRARAAR